jgi:hypothetical protein
MPAVEETDATWVTVDEATEMLERADAGTVGNQLRKSKHLRRARLKTRKTGRDPICYHDDDILMLAAIKREASLVLPAAVRVFDAIKGERLGLD